MFSLNSALGFAPLQYVGAIAPTASRPCRVWQSASFFRKNALRECRSAFLAFLAFLPRQGYSEALPPKDILLAAQKVAAFSGLRGAGRG